jgi:hypothetical protein
MDTCKEGGREGERREGEERKEGRGREGRERGMEGKNNHIYQLHTHNCRP